MPNADKLGYRKQFMVRQESSVRFTKNVVFTIPNLDAYSQEEIQNTWISTSEEQKMLAQQFKVVKKMEQGKGKKSSYRGLEKHTSKGTTVFEKRRLRCIDRVMDEQDIQIEKNIYDHDKLAKISQKTSKKSIKEALKQAKKDAAAARKYLEAQ